MCYNAHVSKWNRTVSNLIKCMYCKHVENIKHRIFECNNVHEIWYSVGKFLSFQIKLKHIVAKFYSKENIEPFVAYRIYKYKMLCRLDSLSETAYNLYNHVKKSIYFYSSVLGHLNENVTNKIFVDFSKTM